MIFFLIFIFVSFKKIDDLYVDVLIIIIILLYASFFIVYFDLINDVKAILFNVIS